jgi:tetratricopeptide (TPR) repeat protein
MKKTISSVLIILLTFAINTVKAQDYKALQDAFNSSYTLETAGNYNGAIDVIKKVYNESSYEVNIRLGWLHYMAGRFSESTTYYSRSIQLMPYSIEARLGYALPAYAMGNTEQVIAKYLEILKIDPNNYTTLYRLGAINYGRKDYNSAYKQFEKLVNMYPFDYDALHMFGWANYRMGKLNEAKVLFNKALLVKPNDASALEGLSLIK